MTDKNVLMPLQSPVLYSIGVALCAASMFTQGWQSLLVHICNCPVVHSASYFCDAGVYEIVSRDQRKTSFAYRLEIPQEPGEVQQELQIKKEASYTLSMKVLY